jgi:hypothetical protein
MASERRQLSDGQVRLWFLHRLNGATALYSEHVCVRLRGALNVPAMYQAFAQVARRHETLRWVIEADDPSSGASGSPSGGGPSCVGVVGDAPIAAAVRFVDLDRFEQAAERERRYRQYASDAVTRPFDLATGPLFRLYVFRFSPTEHALVAVMHHIISDSWSMKVLVADFCSLYGALVAGDPPAGRAPDYGRGAGRADAPPASQLSYWVSKLADAPPPVSLPSHRHRPSRRTFAGAKQRFLLDTPTSAAVKARAREERTTPFVVLLALWTAYLGVVTGRHDVIVGTTTAGRHRKETEPLIGFFVNTLAIRTRVSPAETFRSYLRHVRRVTLDALEHQDVPFDRVVRALDLPRSSTVQPLFEVVCTYLNVAVNELSLPGLDVQIASEDVGTGLTKFDVVLAFADRGATIQGLLDYSVELYDEPEIGSYITRFCQFASAAVMHPDQRLGPLVPIERSPVDIVQTLRSVPAYK